MSTALGNPRLLVSGSCRNRTYGGGYPIRLITPPLPVADIHDIHGTSGSTYRDGTAGHATRGRRVAPTRRVSPLRRYPEVPTAFTTTTHLLQRHKACRPIFHLPISETVFNELHSRTPLKFTPTLRLMHHRLPYVNDLEQSAIYHSDGLGRASRSTVLDSRCIASKTSDRCTETSFGASMPNRTLSPLISTTIMVMLSPIMILSSFLRDKTNIRLLLELVIVPFQSGRSRTDISTMARSRVTTTPRPRMVASHACKSYEYHLAGKSVPSR